MAPVTNGGLDGDGADGGSGAEGGFGVCAATPRSDRATAQASRAIWQRAMLGVLTPETNALAA